MIESGTVHDGGGHVVHIALSTMLNSRLREPQVIYSVQHFCTGLGWALGGERRGGSRVRGADRWVRIAASGPDQRASTLRRIAYTCRVCRYDR